MSLLKQVKELSESKTVIEYPKIEVVSKTDFTEVQYLNVITEDMYKQYLECLVPVHIPYGFIPLESDQVESFVTFDTSQLKLFKLLETVPMDRSDDKYYLVLQGTMNFNVVLPGFVPADGPEIRNLTAFSNSGEIYINMLLYTGSNPYYTTENFQMTLRKRQMFVTRYNGDSYFEGRWRSRFYSTLGDPLEQKYINVPFKLQFRALLDYDQTV